MKTRIILADDHQIVTDGLKTLLEMEDDLEVVGIAVDGEELLGLLSKVEADIVVFDQRMPRMTGLQVLERLGSEDSELPTILLAGTLSDEEVLQALRLNARGVVLKESATSSIRECIRSVMRGELCWPAELMQRAVGMALQGAKERESLAEGLTAREMEIVKHVAAGRSNKAIAKSLEISEGTVKTHLHSIFKKVGVSNRVQLTLYAQEEGIVGIG